MRALLAVVLAAGLAWGLYWVLGARALEARLQAWQQAAGSAGFAAQSVDLRGFPNRFDVTLTAPRFADPQGRFAWRADFAQVFSMSWKPWHLIAALSPEQELSLPGRGQMTLTAETLRGSLRLRPGLDLILQEAILEAAGVSVPAGLGQGTRLDRLVLALAADPSAQTALRLGLRATALDLPPDVAGRLPGLGGQIAELRLDARLMLDRLPDRNWPADPGRVLAFDLREAHLAWGAMLFSARGVLRPDAQGWAEGKLALRLKQGQDLPDALVALGLLPPANRDLWARAVQLLAQRPGNTPQDIQADLVMRDGWMVLGDLPIGPAPLLP